MASKPMGQDEKDRIGQAEMNARRLEAGEFDALDKDTLRAEAGRRGVHVKAGATEQDIISALRGAAAEPAQEA
jgi:hypothetical protein